jgi:NADPH2:quinone reductase
VIAAASTADKLAVCKQHGADELIDYGSGDLRAQLEELAPDGANVIYDPVGGPYTEAAFRSCAWRGRLLVVGFAAGDIPKLPTNLALLKGASIVGVFWGDFARREPGRAMSDLVQLFQWLREDKLRPEISKTYPLERGGEAIRALLDRKVTGKLVITMTQVATRDDGGSRRAAERLRAQPSPRPCRRCHERARGGRARGVRVGTPGESCSGSPAGVVAQVRGPRPCRSARGHARRSRGAC